MHPLAWKEVGAESEDDRKASPPRESAGAHEKEILESNQRRCIYYYEATQTGEDQEATRDTTLRYRSTVESGY